jgi:lysozyme family protein
MAEVFTISGAASAVTSAPPAAQLQNALRALGVTVGDPALSKLAVDGIIGPNTVKAVNHALANYVGGSAAFPRADLTVTKVRQFAGALAALVIQRVQKSGGAVPETKVQARAVVRRPSGLPTPMDEPPAPSGFHWEDRYTWWAVGGVSAILVLSIAAAAVKRRRAAAA